MLRVIFDGDGKQDYYREYPDATGWVIEGNWLLLQKLVATTWVTVALVSAFTVKAVETDHVRPPDLYKLRPYHYPSP